jgi:hypothetical protein
VELDRRLGPKLAHPIDRRDGARRPHPRQEVLGHQAGARPDVEESRAGQVLAAGK